MADRRQPHEGPGQPHRQVRRRRPPRLQPARAERLATAPASSTSTSNRTRGPNGGGLGPRDLPARRRARTFGRYVSTSTDARERQWRHFYYAQDTWRATPKLTLNYGLRLDIINPQTVNEAGNGGWLDLNTGEILVGGVGGIDLAGNVKNNVNWAPRLGATYQINEKTVIRAGYGRSYDIGVFGSMFGHSVTQNLPVLSVQSLNAPNNFDAVFNLAQGPPAPVFVDRAANGRFPLPNGVFTRALPEKQRPPTVDACNVTVQRQLTDAMSVEVGYVGNRGAHASSATARPSTSTSRRSWASPTSRKTNGGRSSPARRRPTSAATAAPSAGRRASTIFCNCGNNWYDSLQAKFTRRFSDGYSVLDELHVAEGRAQRRHLLLLRPEPELRAAPAGTGRTPSTCRSSPSCRSARARSRALTGAR